jgi:HAD superfamily hydrolase (TIGR01509 family)
MAIQLKARRIQLSSAVVRFGTTMLVIFDCDGVLVDTERIGSAVVAEFASEFGWPLDTAEATRLFKGAAMPEIWKVIESRANRALPLDIDQRFRRQQLTRLEAELQPNPDLRQTLEHLHVPFCVASNGPHEKMQVTLRVAGVLELFQGKMFSRTDVARSKPAPDLFLHAAHACGVSPEECLVVEDSVVGIAAAQAAKMRVWGFTGMDVGCEEQLLAAGAERVFSRMSDLPALLKTLFP